MDRDARRQGPAHPVSTEWKRAVRARIKELGMEQNELARRLGCAQSSLATLLGPVARQSSLVPAIHAALGWPAPGVPVGPDAAELLHLFVQLPEELRATTLAQVRAMARAVKHATAGAPGR